MSRGKHITNKERKSIELFMKRRIPVWQIAQLLNRSYNCIKREVFSIDGAYTAEKSLAKKQEKKDTVHIKLDRIEQKINSLLR